MVLLTMSAQRYKIEERQKQRRSIKTTDTNNARLVRDFCKTEDLTHSVNCFSELLDSILHQDFRIDVLVLLLT